MNAREQARLRDDIARRRLEAANLTQGHCVGCGVEWDGRTKGCPACNWRWSQRNRMEKPVVLLERSLREARVALERAEREFARLRGSA